MDAINVLGLVVLMVAAIRVVVVIDGLAFMFLRSHRHIRWNRSMRITFAEPFLLAAAVGALWIHGPIAPMTKSSHLLLVGPGALLACSGLLLFVWSIAAYRTVGTGHYIDDDHEVIRSGPYALVRHPMYCAAIFIWLGLALACADWALLTLTFAYVIPTYYFYAREEETMMSTALGSAYLDYAASVPMLFPKPLNIWE